MTRKRFTFVEERARPCPYCKAKTGEPCKSMFFQPGQIWDAVHHRQRHDERAARELAEDARREEFTP